MDILYIGLIILLTGASLAMIRLLEKL